MVREHFPQVTRDILKNWCLRCAPDSHFDDGTCQGREEPSYELFEHWIKAFKDSEPKVAQFRKLAMDCASYLI